MPGPVNPPESQGQRNENRQYFVFEEFCVVVGSNTLPPKVPLSTSVLTRLEQVASTNADLEKYIRDNFIDPAKPFAPIQSDGRRSDYVLQRRGGNAGSALLFYQVRLTIDPTKLSVADRTRLTGELVLLMNKIVTGQSHEPDGADPDDWSITGLTPNWYAAAASDGDSGSPAAPPLPAPDPGTNPDKYTFGFVQATNPPTQQTQLQDSVNAARSAGTPSTTVVAIIDTCPTAGVLDSAPQNYLLRELTGAVVTAGGAVDLVPLAPTTLPQAAGIVPDWEGWLTLWLGATSGSNNATLLRQNYYGMPSHGLFSAGIIKDIAPNVKIHLIGALDGAGISSLDMLAAAFLMLPGLVSAGQSLVVNCSWTTSTISKAGLDPSLPADFIDLSGDFFQLALDLLIDWLHFQVGQVIVVAAAGNNALAEPSRPVARHPAKLAQTLDYVIAVSAVKESDPSQAAEYSNDASGADGIATIGGDANLSSGPIQGETYIPTVNGQPDAVKGVFWQPNYPFTDSTTPYVGTVNSTGWAYWSGTSFATPIATAIAAILWNGKAATSTPSAIIGDVRGAASLGKVAGFTSLNAIYARQTP